jgi:hypothetical protein
VIPRLTHQSKLTADITQRKTSYHSAVAPGNSHSGERSNPTSPHRLINVDFDCCLECAKTDVTCS